MSSKEYQLHVFSAGAVAPPLEKAVYAFQKKYGINSRFTPGKPESLLAAITIEKAGDIISTGAEYVLDDAEDQGLVVKGSRRTLGLRRSVLIVQPSNPTKIKSLKDLCREGIRVGIATGGCLKGVWDDIASKAGLTDLIRENITEHADACGSLMGLIHQKKVDVIFGWNAFKAIWPNTCEIIELPFDLQVYRSTVAGMISYSKNPELAKKFIDFLVTDEVKKIYSDYDWIHSI
ncbi:MAG: molybdate transport system substrate-binding protein [Thermoproteota archaeon]|nr:molybdate transport system substrate-binding protein [Thermoproteota archaeon]